MRFVKQKHRNGCGIAALAMLTNSNYREILDKIYPNRIVGTKLQAIQGAAHLGQILRQLGLKSQVIDPSVTKLSQIKDPLLIWLHPPPHSSAGHLVVWDPDSHQILDPHYGPSMKTAKYERGAFVYLKLSCKA